MYLAPTAISCKVRADKIRLCKLKDGTGYLAGKKVGINCIGAFGHGRDKGDSARVGE